MTPAINAIHSKAGNLRRGLDAIDQLGPGDEWHTQAGGSQDPSGAAGIILQVMQSSLDRANRNGISDQIGFEPGLDHEQATDLTKLRHS